MKKIKLTLGMKPENEIYESPHYKLGQSKSTDKIFYIPESSRNTTFLPFTHSQRILVQKRGSESVPKLRINKLQVNNVEELRQITNPAKM